MTASMKNKSTYSMNSPHITRKLLENVTAKLWREHLFKGQLRTRTYMKLVQ
jgi:hypothetical protein